MYRNKDYLLQLFMKTGMPEAYTAYSALNDKEKETEKGKRRAK